eukprot:CAMPEP_0116905206 /NCGR_PEP_ID=MMETSP0467-20121206/11854_1 /TAXON_ID=283647 /ORGANISM="Mesodinium pulex, Strain SPMC105" /LENGTH=50 /DNA_ID=CAMNT_0004579953 /DNA_START=357 /DNA_END=509 /DNA_ORIENTATION=+
MTLHPSQTSKTSKTSKNSKTSKTSKTKTLALSPSPSTQSNPTTLNLTLIQ